MKNDFTVRVFGNPAIAYAVITGAIEHFAKDIPSLNRIG